MHKETMEMANYWINEKQLVHKLFKVLVPRYQNYKISFTKLYKTPNIYPIVHYDRAVLELQGREYIYIYIYIYIYTYIHRYIYTHTFL